MITFVVILCLLPYSLALQELTDDTFASFITKPGKFCIMFYSPSCGTCQAALPIFKRVAQLIEADSTVDIKLSQIDVSEHIASGDRYDVWNYPTMVIDGGDFPYQQVYKGSPTSPEELVKWIEEFGSPSYVPPLSALCILDEASFSDCVEERICWVKFTDSRCMSQQCLGKGSQIHELANHANKQLQGEGVRVAQVDLAKYPKIGEKYGIELRGASVNKLFINEKMYHYHGSEDWAIAVKYIEARLESPLKDLATMSQYASEFLSGTKTCAVALLLPNQDDNTETQNHYLSWAESTRDFCSHYLVTNTAMLQGMEIVFPRFVIKHSAKTLISTEPPHVEVNVVTEAGENWFAEQFKKSQFSLVNVIDSGRISTQLRDLDHYVGIYVENSTWGAEMQNLKEAIAGIAKKFQDKGIPFFIGNVADVSVDFEEVDTINANVPFLFMIRDKNYRKYTPNFKTLQEFKNEPEELYFTYLENYINQYLEGKVAPTIKSDKDHGVMDGVLDVVGLSIDRVLGRTDKDILLLMTSSNQCRSCVRYENALLKFGEKFENPKTLTVGMINVETNQLPRKLMMKSSPPHVVLLPAGRSGPFENLAYFFNEISEENIRTFVTHHGKHNVLDKKDQNITDEKEHKGKQGTSVQEDATAEEDPDAYQSIHATVTEEMPYAKESDHAKEDTELTKHKEKIEKMMNERFGGMNTDSQHHNNFNPREHKYDEKYELEFDPDEEHEAIDEDSSSNYGHDEL